MKKSVIGQLFALAAMATFMASCTETPEYINVIPADASAVVGIHIRSLIDKSGVSDDDKRKLIDAMESGLNPATFRQVEKIMKDGSESGLSVKDPVYFFAGGRLPSAAVVMKMDDMDKFGKALEVMLPEVSDYPVTEAGGYRLFRLGESVCAFNESALLIIAVNHGDSIVSGLMKQSRDESIAGNAYFRNMSGKKGDITFFFTPDALPGTYKRRMSAMSGLEHVNPGDIAVIGSLSFEKEQIALQVETASENKEAGELFKKQNELYGKLNNTFLARFPASTLAYSSLNVDGEKLYGMLQEYKDFREILSPDNVKELFGAFKGDVSVGLTRVTNDYLPIFAAYAEAASGAALSALYESKAGLGLGRWEEIVRLGEDQYVYKSFLTNVYFGYKDNYIYATNDKSIRENPGKEEDKSLKDAIYAPNIDGKSQYAAIDIKAILNLPVVKMLAAFGGREAAAYMKIASKLSYIEVTGEGNNRANINIRLADEETHSLKQIVDLVKQYAGL